MTPKRGDAALELVETEPRQRTDDLGLASGPEQDEVSLREYLDTVVEGRWVIALAVAIAAAVGIAYAVLAAPTYRTDALIQVEDKKAAKGLLGDFSALLGETSFADTEIEILRSRALLGRVVDELRLDIEAAPRRFPVVGGAIARRRDGAVVASSLLGLRKYGWGGERIHVDRLDVSGPLLGQGLTLVAGEGRGYVLRGPDGERLLEGEVGMPASGPGAEMFVSELVARPGLEFRLVRRSADETVEDLQEQIRISEKGKKTGVLRVALDGRSPSKIAAIVDALARAYVRQNVERGSAEAEKALSFLQEQLPVLRAKLDAAEAELERYRSRSGSVDVTLETQAAVGRIVEIEKAASELKLEWAALRQKFTPDHPALAAVGQRLRRLDEERTALDARLKNLPAAELESARRMRDVKVANELYLAVVNKAQELKVVKEGAIGNVRILDAAILPAKPIAPKPLMVLPLALLLGAAVGVGLAFARRALDQGVQDPDALERALGVGVHASIPHSGAQEDADRQAKRERRQVPVLAAHDPKDLAVEAVRSLRTSLQFALVETRNAVVAVSGPAPGVGKSFVTVNLAHLLGEAGKRVLVVDADLRRGRLHASYGGERQRGLSDVIAGNVTLEQAIRETGSPNVRFLPTGTIPPNPAELLGSERFTRVLADLAASSDVVLLDTPPVLAVTDATIAARHAGVTLLVVRAGAHPLREIAAALRAFARNGVRVQGIVMNDVQLERGLGRRNAYHYQYRYG
jgi:tyrosine-protein kinase Etk/Wzc